MCIESVIMMFHKFGSWGINALCLSVCLLPGYIGWGSLSHRGLSAKKMIWLRGGWFK